MEKERKIKVLSLLALIVAVLGLTVAFAALSQTLTINGSASVNAAEWDIHFENLSEPEIIGSATVSEPPTLLGTTISGFNVSVTKPGDKIIYTFDIVNSGTIDAFLVDYVEAQKYMTKLTAYSSENLNLMYHDWRDYDFNNDGYVNSNDIRIFSRSINYDMYYEDGTKIKVGDTLKVGETKKIKFIVEHKETSERVFEKTIKIFDPDAFFEFYYEQAD